MKKNITEAAKFVIAVHFSRNPKWESDVRTIMEKARLGQARTGQEFYDAKLQVVSHVGGAGKPLSSAFLEVSLKTGAVVAVFSNEAMVYALNSMVQRQVFHQKRDAAPSSETEILSALKVTQPAVAAAVMDAGKKLAEKESEKSDVFKVERVPQENAESAVSKEEPSGV